MSPENSLVVLRIAITTMSGDGCSAARGHHEHTQIETPAAITKAHKH